MFFSSVHPFQTSAEFPYSQNLKSNCSVKNRSLYDKYKTPYHQSCLSTSWFANNANDSRVCTVDLRDDLTHQSFAAHKVSTAVLNKSPLKVADVFIFRQNFILFINFKQIILAAAISKPENYDTSLGVRVVKKSSRLVYIIQDFNSSIHL